MTRKLLSIILCLTMVMTVVLIPSSVVMVSAAENTAIYNDYFFVQDYENTESNKWSIGVVVGNGKYEVKEDEGGNHYIEVGLKNDGTEAFRNTSNEISIPAGVQNWNIAFDVQKVSDGLPIGMEYYIGGKAGSFALDCKNFENNDDWYRVAYTSDTANVTVVVTNLSTGMAKRVHYGEVNKPGSYWQQLPQTSDSNTIRLMLAKNDTLVGTIPEGYTALDTCYRIDNVRVWDGNVLDDVIFENNIGNELTEIPDGNVTAKAIVTSDSFVRWEEARTTELTTVLTAYDADGKMIASNVETHNIASEEPEAGNLILQRNDTWAATKTLASTIDLTGLDATRVEMAVWDSADGMRPIGKTYVLGDEAVVEPSETTANMGEATEISSRTNDFVLLDRSTKGSLVTVEGKADTNKGTTVAIIAKGNNSQNTVFVKQFTTANDGSFKLTFDANEEFMSGDTGIIVTLSGAMVNPKALNITIGSEWDAFVDAFKAINNGDAALAFYADYASNLTYYNAGEKDGTKVDVSGLDNNDWANLAFLHSTKNYGKMTSGDVIAEAETLVASLADIEMFIEALNNAKNTEGTEEQKAEAILAVIEDKNAPATFGFGAASNKIAVCKEFAKCEDFGLIQEAYSIFRALTEVQAGLEASALSGFKAIGSADSAKAFFASENGETLGITAETLGYTDAEWKFFFEAYADNNCSDVEDSAGMNGAIAALIQYVEDVNAFLKNANEATDGAAIKALFEAEYDEETFFCKKIAAMKAEGMNVEGIGNVESFYEKLVATISEVADMADVKNVFSDARADELDFEQRAVAALNEATATNAVSQFLANYAKVLKNETLIAYTDRQKTIFAEINVKNATNVTTYADAVATLTTLAGKVSEAEGVLNAMKEAAKADEWENLRELVEGKPVSTTTVLESYIGAFDTHALIDIRALYLRFAKGGNTKAEDVETYVEETFFSITSVCDPFDNAYEAQLDWEQTKGAYESTESTLANFDESAWSVETMANVVKVSGKVDKNGAHRLMFTVTVDDKLIFIKQIETEGTGAFTTNLVLNPDNEKFPAYRAGENVACLRISSETVNSYKLPMFDLYSEEELASVLTDFAGIRNKSGDAAKAAALEQFVENYGDILGITEKVEAAIAYGDADIADSAKKARVYHAMVFVYNKYSDTYQELEDVTEVVGGKNGKTGTDAIVQEMEKIVKLLDEMTLAANMKVNGSIGKWSLIRDKVKDAEKNGWVMLKGSTSGMSNAEIASVYNKMAAKDYIKLVDIEENYEAAVETVKKETANNSKPSNGGGSGGSGGGKVSNMAIGSGIGTEKADVELTPEEAPVGAFNDIADYSWAKTAINGLRKYGLVRGDGNGKYRPGDAITREEFLTLLFRVFEVEEKELTRVEFTDVDQNAWYAKTIATAYELEIVKGFGDGRFGVGVNITRADMAVMILRMAKLKGINLAPVEERVIFNDYASIPEYAFDDIYVLQQANILNGDDYGNFNATKEVTRAESAVAFYNIFNMTKDFVTYSWMNVY